MNQIAVDNIQENMWLLKILRRRQIASHQVMQLQDRTSIVTDSGAFTPGVKVFILDDEGKPSDAPQGQHILANGQKIVIGDGGVLKSMGPEKAKLATTDEHKKRGLIEKEAMHKQISARLESQIRAKNKRTLSARQWELNEELMEIINVEFGLLNERVMDQLCVRWGGFTQWDEHEGVLDLAELKATLDEYDYSWFKALDNFEIKYIKVLNAENRKSDEAHFHVVCDKLRRIRTALSLEAEKDKSS